MTKANPTPHEILTDTVAKLSQLPGRWEAFVDVCNDADSPLRAARSEPVSGGGISDPTPNAAAAPKHGRNTIQRAENRIRDLARAADGLQAIIDDWTAARPADAATIAAVDPEAIWCRNEAHGDHLEPRRPEGGEYCRWCADFNRKHKQLPPARLLDMHARGIHLSENVVRRILKENRTAA